MGLGINIQNIKLEIKSSLDFVKHEGTVRHTGRKYPAGS